MSALVRGELYALASVLTAIVPLPALEEHPDGGRYRLLPKMPGAAALFERVHGYLGLHKDYEVRAIGWLPCEGGWKQLSADEWIWGLELRCVDRPLYPRSGWDMSRAKSGIWLHWGNISHTCGHIHVRKGESNA